MATRPRRGEGGISFVSLMSHHGLSVEEIARLAGPASARTIDAAYRREVRPAITTGAKIMDEVFTGS
jgi:hypothetical protein